MNYFECMTDDVLYYVLSPLLYDTYNLIIFLDKYVFRHICRASAQERLLINDIGFIAKRRKDSSFTTYEKIIFNIYCEVSARYYVNDQLISQHFYGYSPETISSLEIVHCFDELHLRAFTNIIRLHIANSIVKISISILDELKQLEDIYLPIEEYKSTKAYNNIKFMYFDVASYDIYKNIFKLFPNAKIYKYIRPRGDVICKNVKYIIENMNLSGLIHIINMLIDNNSTFEITKCISDCGLYPEIEFMDSEFVLDDIKKMMSDIKDDNTYGNTDDNTNNDAHDKFIDLDVPPPEPINNQLPAFMNMSIHDVVQSILQGHTYYEEHQGLLH
jgi:hypothetical protein